MACILLVKVIPKSSVNAIVGFENEYLKIKIRGAPEKGVVNRALLHFLSDLLEVSISAITLKKGEKSRLKQFEIEGMSEKQLAEKIKDQEEKERRKKSAQK